MLRPNPIGISVGAQAFRQIIYGKKPKFHPGMLRPNPICISVGAKHDRRRNRVSVKIYALYRELD
jgi:tRNA (Thr-GGU) A37 N-methylase